MKPIGRVTPQSIINSRSIMGFSNQNQRIRIDFLARLIVKMKSLRTIKRGSVAALIGANNEYYTW
ncbi:hypothetical protein EDC56_3754 [Sinobacterium caligoides]|uniref:Uncharacterized protein n=1 Tax=Sinobacterium caligoides TaxID=933926 RepID=A0A3N2D598_9GAMM|nr:hypothetical protein EDC56_3754 [Sinobacterium caligoides]